MTPYRSLFLSILCCMSIFGCSSSYTVSPESGKGDYSYNEFNTEFVGKKGSILLRDGREIQSKQIRVEIDSTIWVEQETGMSDKVATSNLERITRKNHVIGAAKGLGLGVIGSGIIFGIAAASDKPLASYDDAIAPMVLAPILGAGIGFGVGHPLHYEFTVDTIGTKMKPSE